MMTRSSATGLILCLALCLGVSCLALAQARPQTPNDKAVKRVAHATGTFEVKLVPLTSDEQGKNAFLGRMSIDKQFHGDLEGTSKGEMMTAGDVAKGSAGYVALEQVTGTLQGRSGSFILQHSATMTRGTPQLSITVVPDSGTGQLEGISGAMTVKITDGKHFYDFEYTLPAAH
ncbi:MAG: DUF3224 domain-containing protein [Candidatus Korobacteraceae bacterium]